MTSAMAAFGIAVGGSSLICCVLMQNRRAIADRLATAPDRTAAMIPAAAGVSPVGSAATTPRQIVQAIRATQAEATAEEALTEVAEAINAARRRTRSNLPQEKLLDSF